MKLSPTCSVHCIGASAGDGVSMNVTSQCDAGRVAGLEIESEKQLGTVAQLFDAPTVTEP